MHRYYSTQRPIAPGSYPKTNKVVDIVNFDTRRHVDEISRPAWGYVDYNEPLTDKEADDYELICERVERIRAGEPPPYTIAVDFDGTLCADVFPDIGEPRPRMIEYIKRQAENGARIILYTCRENGTRRALLDEAVAFCVAHGIPLYAVNENPSALFSEQYGSGTGRKVYADLYIDDKAINTADIERGFNSRNQEHSELL